LTGRSWRKAFEQLRAMQQLTKGVLQIALFHGRGRRASDEQDVEAGLDLYIDRAQDRAQPATNAVANDCRADLSTS
jgi:hypothetical protein